MNEWPIPPGHFDYAAFQKDYTMLICRSLQVPDYYWYRRFSKVIYLTGHLNSPILRLRLWWLKRRGWQSVLVEDLYPGQISMYVKVHLIR